MGPEPGPETVPACSIRGQILPRSVNRARPMPRSVTRALS